MPDECGREQKTHSGPHKLEGGPETVDNIWTQWYAARHGKLDRMKVLLRREGYDSELADAKHGRTAAHWACKYGHTELVHLLITHGTGLNSVDLGGNSSLHFAAGWGTKVLVGLLLSHGADHACCNNKGQTPLDCCDAHAANAPDALKQACARVAAFLRAHGGDRLTELRG